MSKEQNIKIEPGDLVRYTPELSNFSVIGVVIEVSRSQTMFPHVIIRVMWQNPITKYGIIDGWYPYGDGFTEIEKI